MPAVRYILETALYVDNLDRSESFYCAIFGCRTKMSDGRMRALGIADRQMLLLFERGKSADGEPTPRGLIPGHDGRGPLHVALAIDADAVAEWREHLAARGVAVESHVRPEQGGDSLYFRDPDGHLIELATPTIWNV